MRALTILFAATYLVFAFCSCGGDDDSNGNGGTTTDLSFAGEQAAFPDFSYDTGWQPEGSPIQVQIKLVAEGKLTANADAILGGSSDEPILSGNAGTGKYALTVKLVFQVLLKVDFSALSYEGPVDENADINFEITGEVAFDPFLIGGEALIKADVPETQLAKIPLAGSVPGVTGDLIIMIAGTVDSKFVGVCAAANSSTAQYVGKTVTSADLVLRPSLEISIPFLLDETLDAFDIPVAVPATEMTMDLGTKDVSPGGGAVDGGGSLGTVGTCDGGLPVGDVVGGDDVTTQPDDVTTQPDDAVEDTGGGKETTDQPCKATCAGCCEGEVCKDGTDGAACGSGGSECIACEGAFVCQSGACIDDTIQDCASQCDGCCAENSCLPGTQDYACGTGGQACLECDAGFDCNAGVCEPGVMDCAADCDGCCSGDLCMPGTKDYACGMGGEDCFACGANEACASGMCEDKPSCMATCPGCCDGDECKAGSKGWQCGSYGNVCENCGAGYSCEDGLCVELPPAGCWESCDGCCDDEFCMDGTDSAACGTGGNQCLACPDSFICEAGDCVLDPNSLWNVVAINGELLSAADESWDTFGGLPDLYVVFSAGWDDDTGWAIQEESSVKDDSNFASWDEEVLVAVFAKDLLDGGMGVHLYDSDVLKDESIGSCGISIFESDFYGEPRGSCGSFGTFEVMFKIVPY